MTAPVVNHKLTGEEIARVAHGVLREHFGTAVAWPDAPADERKGLVDEVHGHLLTLNQGGEIEPPHEEWTAEEQVRHHILTHVVKHFQAQMA